MCCTARRCFWVGPVRLHVLSVHVLQAGAPHPHRGPDQPVPGGGVPGLPSARAEPAMEPGERARPAPRAQPGPPRVRRRSGSWCTCCVCRDGVPVPPRGRPAPVSCLFLGACPGCTSCGLAPCHLTVAAAAGASPARAVQLHAVQALICAGLDRREGPPPRRAAQTRLCCRDADGAGADGPAQPDAEVAEDNASSYEDDLELVRCAGQASDYRLSRKRARGACRTAACLRLPRQRALADACHAAQQPGGCVRGASAGGGRLSRRDGTCAMQHCMAG